MSEFNKPTLEERVQFLEKRVAELERRLMYIGQPWQPMQPMMPMVGPFDVTCGKVEICKQS